MMRGVEGKFVSMAPKAAMKVTLNVKRGQVVIELPWPMNKEDWAGFDEVIDAIKSASESES